MDTKTHLKPFCMKLKQGDWSPHKTDDTPIDPEPGPSNPQDRETIQIHKRLDDSRYLKLLKAGKCYEIKSHKKFCMFNDTGEWVPHKGQSSNSQPYPVIDCPEPDSPTEETVFIYEGSTWVRIGGRWYRIP